MNMEARSIEKEIEVIETVLGVLYRCLALYRGMGDSTQYRETRADITMIEKELNLLISEKEAELNAIREP
jgi:hypothetical protein